MMPFSPGFYETGDLRTFGFGSIGKNVRIATNCTIVGAKNVEIGDNVRIDGYCSLFANGSGWIRIGSYVHVGSYCSLSGGDGIEMGDFSGLSQGVRVYSRTDDYSGACLTNPTVPARYTGVIGGPVLIGRHVVIGAGSVILPNVQIGEGSAVGALSLVRKSLEPWGVYFGAPAKRIKNRSRQLLDLERQLIGEQPHAPAEDFARQE
jgi:acetyltransferase-like isoleucine patch superfamily enzyme